MHHGFFGSAAGATRQRAADAPREASSPRAPLPARTDGIPARSGRALHTGEAPTEVGILARAAHGLPRPGPGDSPAIENRSRDKKMGV